MLIVAMGLSLSSKNSLLKRSKLRRRRQDNSHEQTLRGTRRRLMKSKTYELHQQDARRRYARRRSQGLCTKCGVNKTDKSECSGCYERNGRRAVLRRVGATPELFRRMWAAQSGACAICDTPFSNRKDAHVDHCHASHRVRGLLCSNCNCGIGQFKDNTTRLLSAVDYLTQNGTL
jgi:hypothetical protein